MDNAATVRWGFLPGRKGLAEWLACPACDTYVKPAYFNRDSGVTASHVKDAA